jgi:hypothetical protein
MGAPVLPRRRQRRLAGLLGREVRRPVDHDRPGAHGLRSGERSPEDRVAQCAGGVQLALRDAAPDGVESTISREAPGGVESAICGEAPGALTLDDLIAGVWEQLSVCEVVRCPVCGGKMSRGRVTTAGADTGWMVPRADTGGLASSAEAPHGAPHGDCVDCGTQLH